MSLSMPNSISCLLTLVPCSLQKARLARIQIAKATSGAAFVSKKKAAEAKMAAKAAGMPVDDNFKEDVFELQHHHLLRCLEKTTVSYYYYILRKPKC